jgi:N-acetylglucosamine kinase-like BadF-type ATPase
VALVGGAGDLVLGRGEGGPSNPTAVGFDEATEQIRRAIRSALAAAGQADGAGIARAVLGIAGTSRPEVRARLAALLAERLELPIQQLRLVTDVALILPAAGRREGVALVAGTGSAAYGVAADGRTALVGGWGYLLGDEGSAFDVGREALRAVLRADDERGPSTALRELLSRELAIGQPRDLIRVIYQADSPRNAVAGLAPLVVAAAGEGDPVARQILARAGRDLGQLVRAAARRLGLKPGFAVVGTGGAFGAGELLVAPVRVELARAGTTDFSLLENEPALGALRLATSD